MPRPTLPADRIAPAAARQIERFHDDVVREVQQAIAENAVVVVGMGHNPHVRHARRALGDAGIRYAYLEYGSYLSQWQRRLALKLWSGWPWFPQVFVKGTLLGGASDVAAALADGSLQEMLAREP